MLILLCGGKVYVKVMSLIVILTVKSLYEYKGINILIVIRMLPTGYKWRKGSI